MTEATTKCTAGACDPDVQAEQDAALRALSIENGDEFQVIESGPQGYVLESAAFGSAYYALFAEYGEGPACGHDILKMNGLARWSRLLLKGLVKASAALDDPRDIEMLLGFIATVWGMSTTAADLPEKQRLAARMAGAAAARSYIRGDVGKGAIELERSVVGGGPQPLSLDQMKALLFAEHRKPMGEA